MHVFLQIIEESELQLVETFSARGKITVIPFHCKKMLQCMLSYSVSALKVAHVSVSAPVTGGLQIKTMCISTGFF